MSSDDLDRRSSSDPTEEQDSPPVIRRGRILIVEDQPALRDLLALALRHDGHAVVRVESAEAALEHLRTAHFDVIVSDLTLAGAMTGWQLVAAVRARWPRTGFVLATGSGAEISPAVAAAAQVDAILSKPFSVTDLRHVVARLIARGRTTPRATGRDTS